jgi:hypothetical protein
LVSAARGAPLMVRLSFQHSLGRLTQPEQRSGKPIAARSVFECEEELRSSLELPFRIAPTFTATRCRGFGSVDSADGLIRTMRLRTRVPRLRIRHPECRQESGFAGVLGKRIVHIRHASPKHLVAAGSMAGTVVQALATVRGLTLDGRLPRTDYGMTELDPGDGVAVHDCEPVGCGIVDSQPTRTKTRSGVTLDAILFGFGRGSHCNAVIVEPAGRTLLGQARVER